MGAGGMGLWVDDSWVKLMGRRGFIGLLGLKMPQKNINEITSSLFELEK